MVAVSLWLMATSVMGEGYVTFNGTACTKAIDGKVAVGDVLTRDKMVNNGVTVSAAGAAKNSLIDGANWSDGAAVSAENDYLISGPNGRVATLSGEVGFGGKSLTLGEVGGNKGFLVPVGSTSFTIGGEGLIINNGGFVWNSSYQKPTLFNGKLKVNTTRSSPAVFWDHWSGAQHHTFNFTTLVGESTAGINFTGQSHASDEVYKNRLSFSGDWSAYYGLVKIATYYTLIPLFLG